MSEKIATKRLRRMLDERGVEHQDHYLSTSWIAGGILHMASEQLDGTLVVDKLTPEQAIAATLGGGKLTAEQVRKAIFNGSSYASYDGAKYYADGIGMQAIADELNTTLGGNGKSRYSELFGTPERAARTLVNLNCDGSGCDGCSLGDIECNYGYDALLEWLRGDAE